MQKLIMTVYPMKRHTLYIDLRERVLCNEKYVIGPLKLQLYTTVTCLKTCLLYCDQNYIVEIYESFD